MTVVQTTRMNTLPATTVRTALMDYKVQLVNLYRKYPETFKYTHPQLIEQIDRILYDLAGNIDSVVITPASCRTWP